jgi:type IV secretion system protein VirB9
MIRPTATALALALFAVPLALSAQDSRLVEVPYDEARVVRVDGQVKVQATIRFDDSEAIENVAIGDSTAWQITPNKRANLLFVKPLEARASTNMTVVTNKRTYLFDLVASPNSKPLYVLSFTYPDEPEEEPAQLAGATASEDAIADPLATVDPAELNFAWASSGDVALLPVRIFDDGEAVFLTWPRERPLPAILTTNSEGDEGPLNFSVREDVIVLDGVPREIVLRSGEDRATLVNTGPERPPRQTRAETNPVSTGKVES